ncbi:AAA family ATPase [Sphingomonas sanguinis]|uniref:ExeA family protein n=1 Tax=Sphingomonas sanguinis TaxID=33051 RepID=UPI001C582D09|nr:AAA family ATPase [Sphingomonas sanguinis]QXT37685.1 AAA family ATPase [Sphingomonas sanguinis]
MYETHFGLGERPFQLTPDPRFWFQTATHGKAMAYLGYGLAQGEGFIVITGDVGAGKTTLVGHLVETLDTKRLRVLHIVSTAVEPQDLLRVLAGQLGVDAQGLTKAALLAAIERALNGVAREGRRILLIVDEAQALPLASLEELRMLSNFQAGGHALLQILLVGQPEFRERLLGSAAVEQLRQRVIAIHHLDPMEPEEVPDYIAHRLAVAGWTGRPDFAADAFDALYDASGGVPRRLNVLAGRVLLQAAIEGVELIGRQTVESVAADMAADMGAGREPPMPIAAEPEPVAPIFNTSARMGDPLFSAGTLRSGLGLNGHAADPITRVMPERQEAPRSTHRVVAPPPAPEPVSLRPMPEPAAPPSPVAEEKPAPAAEASPVAALETRVAQLEARLEQQEAALRRVLTLLVDWSEIDNRGGEARRDAGATIRPGAWGHAA